MKRKSTIFTPKIDNLLSLVPFPQVGKQKISFFLVQKKVHQEILLGKLIFFFQMCLKKSGNFQGNNVFLLN